MNPTSSSGSGPATGQEPSSGNPGWLREPSLWLPVALLVVLRLPSLFEPHWYTDEAGYATTAWLSTHGASLYLTVWNNKPPLLFWIYDLALSWFGPSELGIHLMSTLAGVVTLAALWGLLRMRLRGLRVWLPMLAAALLLGTPLLNGDLALPENFLVAPEALGMLVVALSLRPGQRRAPGLALLGGFLFGLACLLQQTSLAPALAAAMVGLLAKEAHRLRWTAAFGLALVLTVGAALAPYLISAGPQNVFFFLVRSFQTYTATSLPVSVAGLLPRALALLLLGLGLLTGRGRARLTQLGLAWLAAELVVFALPDRPYAHFLLPAVAPACLVLAGAGLPSRAWWVSRASALRSPLAAAALLGALIWASMLAPSGSQGLYTVNLTASYLPRFAGLASGRISTAEYASDYDARALAEDQAAAWVRQQGLEGASAVVWSADSWAYLQGGLRPVVPTPAIYMDQAWLGEKGLLRLVEKSRPELVIVTDDALSCFGPIQPLLQHDYHRVERSADGAVWELLPGETPATSVPTPQWVDAGAAAQVCLAG